MPQPKVERVSIAEQAAKLTKPYTMIDLAQLDDLALSVYLCQGTMPQHRHLDQDELFLVHSGTITLESDWGTVVLRPGELALAPKGLAHRSSSLLHSLVLLFQPRLVANRRNGDRRLFTLKEEGRLEKLSVPAVGRQLSMPHVAVVLSRVDTFDLTLTAVRDTGPWQQHDHQAALVLCHTGRLSLEGDAGNEELHDGELLVVPKGVRYRLSSVGGAQVLSTQRHKQPGLPLEE